MLRSFISKILGEQARSPKAGTFLGWLFAKSMETSNTPMLVHMVVHILNPQPNSVIVELGPGNGQSLEILLRGRQQQQQQQNQNDDNNERNDNEDDGYNPSHVYGIEISDHLRNILKNKFEKEISSGKLSLHENDAKSLPFIKDSTVDYILASNVIYFLDPLQDYMIEMFRILKPGGRIVWGITDMVQGNDMTHFKNQNWTTCMQIMKYTGFTNVEQTDEFTTSSFTCFALIGTKPPTGS